MTPSTAWKETVEPGESEQFERHAESLHLLQLEELRPLGNFMRARNPAYRVSTTERKASPEPDGAEWLA